MAQESERHYWVGFDLGGTKMMAAVLDEDFTILASERKKTKGANGKGFEAGLERIVGTIQDALRGAKVSEKQIAGIGVGFPGPLDLDRGVVLQAPNLGWTNAPLKETLEKRFGCPVVVANDVDAGTFGEYCFGAARNARCVVGAFPGTGIGGACVYEGRIIRGRTNSCMEIGHLIVVPNGNLCGCGRRGCLETVASRLAIAAEAAVAASRGLAPHLLEAVGTDVAEIRSGALAEAIKAGDKAIEEIVRSAAAHLGLAMANVVNLLAPDVVVLGGGLVEQMPGIFVEEARAAVKNWAMKSLAGTVKVAAAKLGDNATAMGAAVLAAGLEGKRA